jgi:hypothetical protein
MDYLNQKYKSLEQIEKDYPAIQAAYARGFPEAVLERFRGIWRKSAISPDRACQPSEDNFGATLWEVRRVLPQSGTPEENLAALTRDQPLYASVINLARCST